MHINLMCEYNMLTDIFIYNNVLIHAQIGSVELALLCDYTMTTKIQFLWILAEILA